MSYRRRVAFNLFAGAIGLFLAIKVVIAVVPSIEVWLLSRMGGGALSQILLGIVGGFIFGGSIYGFGVLVNLVVGVVMLLAGRWALFEVIRFAFLFSPRPYDADVEQEE